MIGKECFCEGKLISNELFKDDSSEMSNETRSNSSKDTSFVKIDNISNESLMYRNPRYKSKTLKAIIEKIKIIISDDYKHNIFAAFLYGSYVTGTYKPYSDVDLMLISNQFEYEPMNKTNEFDHIDFSVYEINKEYAEDSIFNYKYDFLNQFFCAPLLPIKNEKYIYALQKRAILNKLLQYKKYWHQGADKVIEHIYNDTILKFTTFGWQRHKEKIPWHIKYLRYEYKKLINELQNIGIGQIEKETEINYNKLKIYKDKFQRIYFSMRGERGNGFYHMIKQAVKIEKINFTKHLEIED